MAAHVALPTAAVVLAWLCTGIVLVGCGFLIRRLLLGSLSDEPVRRLACADLWLGLAALCVYLLVWNLVWPVRWEAWLAPAAAGVVGAVWGGSRLHRLRAGRRTLGALALSALAVLWFADQALGPAEDYDFGLYHLNLIAYAETHPAIPGLANLHVRLGTGDTHLLFASFLDRGLWPGSGPHLADGLLAALLFVELGSRLALRRSTALAGSFTSRLALMLIPATVLVAEIRPTHRISSPNLDFAAFVGVAVGMLYLAEWVENRSRTAALTATAALALVSTSRPLYWLPTGLALALVVGGATRRGGAARPQALRTAALVGALPLLLLLGWTARQAILSGYPFFPSAIGGLPVDWRVPHSVVHAQNRVDFAWARWAGEDPNVVLGSWHWLGAWWFPRQRWQLDMVFPPLLLSCLVPSLARRGLRDAARSRRTPPMRAVLVPSVATLAVWFFVAPDPRFAWAPIWLVPTALAAWALPTLTGRPSGRLLAAAAAVAAVAAAALATIGVDDITRLVPSAIVGWAIVAALALPLRQRYATLLAYASVVSVLLAAFAVIGHGGIDVVVADKRGPLGTPVVPTPTVVDAQTASGLHVVQPTNGGDQCWHVLLCVPAYGPVNSHLRLRGSGIDGGFSVGGR